MLVLRVLTCLVLLSIAVQDLKSRSVYWFWFPILTTLFLLTGLYQFQVKDIIIRSLINSGFIILQLLVLTIYFSIKQARLVNITQDLLGWGDILLLLSICWYFSTFNLIVFYLFSLVLTLLIWGTTILLIKKNYKQIPLAGLQAIIFVVCLVADWKSTKIDLASDAWIMNYLK